MLFECYSNYKQLPFPFIPGLRAEESEPQVLALEAGATWQKKSGAGAAPKKSEAGTGAWNFYTGSLEIKKGNYTFATFMYR